jgi:hypothetical protein
MTASESRKDIQRVCILKEAINEQYTTYRAET